jgi:hypothetical protein
MSDRRFKCQSKSGRTSAPRLPQAVQVNLVFNVGQPHVVRPLVGAQGDPVRALVVGAIDQQAATPDARISPRVIFWVRVISSVAIRSR